MKIALLAEKSVKALYPVLEDAHGNIIDGFHRLEADPEWPRKTLEHIKTPTQLVVARINANYHRKIPEEERRKQIAELAKKWKGTYLNFLLHYKLI